MQGQCLRTMPLCPSGWNKGTAPKEQAWDMSGGRANSCRSLGTAVANAPFDPRRPLRPRQNVSNTVSLRTDVCKVYSLWTSWDGVGRAFSKWFSKQLRSMRVTQSSEHVPDPPFCQSSCFDLVSIWGVSHKCFQVGEESPVAKNRMFEKASCNIRFNTFLPERDWKGIQLTDPEIQQAGFILSFLCFSSLNKCVFGSGSSSLS